ncbi:hypothetical protein E2562_021813 [Oryza meyeriana var. granulata]|uniref:Uncharacterized protein n=1 Tax=Oryza meyeriana var. granulata TaxID=110450 RepID=A0A6G1EN94_9ORYZ|nr:hypothetical protein E2562_021813 [Oryza meyeriana var. granulata]
MPRKAEAYDFTAWENRLGKEEDCVTLLCSSSSASKTRLLHRSTASPHSSKARLSMQLRRSKETSLMGIFEDNSTANPSSVCAIASLSKLCLSDAFSSRLLDREDKAQLTVSWAAADPNISAAMRYFDPR